MFSLSSIKKTGSIVALFFVFYNLQAQNSIQIIPSLNPPYSTLLSDYYNAKTGLSLTLLNTDASQPFLQGYLRITIEGQGVKLQSGSYGTYNSIDMMEGNSVTLYPNDLAPYFNAQRLQGSIGFGANQPNVFPEGSYDFCFEVLDKNTSRLIGSKQCGQVYLSYSDPVELSFPEKGKQLESSIPFSLLFQWKPQHLNVQNTEYELTLVEVPEGSKLSEDLFLKLKPIYTVKLNETKLLYGAQDPILLVGKKYAWRVHAKAYTANKEQESIKNNGYSEIYWFSLK